MLCSAEGEAISLWHQELAMYASATGSPDRIEWFPKLLFVWNLINIIVSCIGHLCWREKKEKFIFNLQI